MTPQWYWIGTGNKTHAIFNMSASIDDVAICGQAGMICWTDTKDHKCKRCLKALEKLNKEKAD